MCQIKETRNDFAWYVNMRKPRRRGRQCHRQYKVAIYLTLFRLVLSSTGHAAIFAKNVRGNNMCELAKRKSAKKELKPRRERQTSRQPIGLSKRIRRLFSQLIFFVLFLCIYYLHCCFFTLSTTCSMTAHGDMYWLDLLTDISNSCARVPVQSTLFWCVLSIIRLIYTFNICSYAY